MAKEVGHDETPALIYDHKFVPKDEWWSLCVTCNLGAAAHAESETDPEKAMMQSYRERKDITQVTPVINEHIAYADDMDDN